MDEKSKGGGCQCGAVRFRTTDTPARVIACHCTTCKQRTGAAYGIGVYFAEADVDIYQGRLRTYEFRSDESGRWIRHEFCEVCGSAISWTLEMRPGVRGMAGGCYDDTDWYRVDGHIWTQSARSDMCYPPQMAVYEKALPPA